MEIQTSKNFSFYPIYGLISNSNIIREFGSQFKRKIEPQKQDNFQGIILISNTYCNMNCRYCYSKEFNNFELDLEKSKRFIDGVIDSGKDKLIVHFFGGEPTLRPGYIKSIVDYLSKKKNLTLYYNINTNGTLSESLLKYLVENRFKIIVSSDGLPSFTQSYREINKNTEKSIELLAKNNARPRIRCTVSNKNIKKLHNALEYWYNLGAEFIHFEPVNPYGMNRDGEDLMPSKTEYVNAIKEVTEHAEELKMWVISSPFTNLLSPTNTFCTACAGDYLVLTPDNYITSCLRVQGYNKDFDDFIIGDFSGSTVNYYNDKIKSIRQVGVDGSDHCKNCNIKYICGGGCIMRNYIYSGDFYKPDGWECYVKRNLINWAVQRIGKYVNGEKFPSLLGQHVFERIAFNNPAVGQSVLKEKIKKSEKKHLDLKDKKNYFIYDIVGTSEEEFLNLRRYSRCECF